LIVFLTEGMQPPWFPSYGQKDKTLTPKDGSKGLHALAIFNAGSA